MKCKKCKHEKPECTCQTVDKCEAIDASCVIYNKNVDVSDINCIADVPAGTNLKVILEKFDEVFCEINNVPLIPCVKSILGFGSEIQSTSQAVLLQAIQNYICGFQDTKVKVTQSDTSSGYLFDKIIPGDCLEKAVVTDATGSQKLRINLNWGCISSKLPLCFEVQASECIIVDTNNCAPQPLTPVISKSGLVLSGVNCNGTLQWYNNNGELVSTGAVFNASPNESYYARCSNSCGDSGVSNLITIGNIITYKTKRTASFTRNNCGTNDCNIPCVGSSFVFEKEYTSTISQEHVNSLAENDISFTLEGQNLINLQGTCVCSDCTCESPMYNSNIIINNASCEGNIISANGQILFGGISDANKVGYSVGAGDYNGASYSSAFPLNNFSQGNITTTPSSVKLVGLSIETRIVFRLFNGSNTCFKDVVVLLSPPDCTKEQVIINDIIVGCEVPVTTCQDYKITAGGTIANVWVELCGETGYTFKEVLANQTVTYCAKSVPQVTGGVVTNMGNCQ